MDREPSIKIRTLPRPEEVKKAAEPAVEAASPASRWFINLGIAGCCAAMAFMFLSKNPPRSSKPKVQSQDLTSVKVQASAEAAVNKYLMESQMKTEMLHRARQLENLNSKADDYDTSYEDGVERQSYGVQFDQEDTASKVFEDLHDNDYQPADLLPGDRINARLAKNKWTNELERRERVTFVREFIKSAYDRGYEVQLDQNLVVVGVKKIGNQKVSIDQVLNKLAKQGL
jgi:hypothetical protein